MRIRYRVTGALKNLCMSQSTVNLYNKNCENKKEIRAKEVVVLAIIRIGDPTLGFDPGNGEKEDKI